MNRGESGIRDITSESKGTLKPVHLMPVRESAQEEQMIQIGQEDPNALP